MSGSPLWFPHRCPPPLVHCELGESGCPPRSVGTTTTPGGELVVICTDVVTGDHLATLTWRPRSGLYTLHVKSALLVAFGQVAMSCSCQLLTHPSLLCHHRLGYPSLQRLRRMHLILLVSGLPRSLPPLPPSLAPPCTPCVEGRQRTAPHSSSFPPTTSLLILHMDNLSVLRLHADRRGEFSSSLLEEFCREEGVTRSFTLSAFPQHNGIAERRIGLVMEVAGTSMIHATFPHFLWSFAVRYATHQLNLWLRVSEPETSLTLRWTGEVSEASAFRVWGSLAIAHDTTRTSFLLAPFAASSLAFPPTRLAGSFTTQPCVVSCPPRTSPLTNPHPPSQLAPSGVSHVTPPPLAEPLEVSSGPADGGDPTADDTAASRRYPRLKTPHGFPLRTSSPHLQPVAVDSGAAGSGGAGGEGSKGPHAGGAEPGVVDSGAGGAGGTGARGGETVGAGGSGPKVLKLEVLGVIVLGVLGSSLYSDDHFSA
ncbi:unnamed protein product [Closterium sp. NIES-54]